MAKRSARDLFSAFIGCIGSLAMLAALLPGLLSSAIRIILIGGAIMTGIVIVLSDLLSGRNALKSLTSLQKAVTTKVSTKVTKGHEGHALHGSSPLCASCPWWFSLFAVDSKV